MFSYCCVLGNVSVSGNGACVGRWCVESHFLMPLVESQFLMPLSKIAGTFSDAWNQNDHWREHILNWQERVPNQREQVIWSEKLNSDENSIVEFHGTPTGFPNQGRRYLQAMSPEAASSAYSCCIQFTIRPHLVSNLLGTYNPNDEAVSFFEQIAANKGRFSDEQDQTLLCQWRLCRLRP